MQVHQLSLLQHLSLSELNFLMKKSWCTEHLQEKFQLKLFLYAKSQFKLTPGARFSKVPRLFDRNSGDIILFVSSKRRHLKARNFAVILIFIPSTTYEQTSFTY